MGKFIVFGAHGHVGSAVSSRLIEAGEDVSKVGKSDWELGTSWRSCHIGETNLKSFDAAIYCVGHCPPGGFWEAVRYPLSQLSFSGLNQEVALHVTGPVQVFQDFLPAVRSGGCFVFMSSSATRLLQMPRDKRPPINIYHHLAVIAAEDALIEGMRMDPEVKQRGIKIHRIAPAAIGDSPFHSGGPKLPVTVTTAEVVGAIVKSLDAEDHQDVVMVPK